MLPKLLDALEFRCDNTAYRPVMDAVELLHRYKDRDGRLKHYDPTERVPVAGVVKAEWRDAVIDNRGRVQQVPYELCALGALRDAIRRREVGVVGATRWRNPETDLPAEFDLHRDVHYTAIAQPTDPTEFVTGLCDRVAAALANLAEAVRTGAAGGARIGARNQQVWITVPRPVAQPEPDNLDAIKDELVRRWGVVSLLDVLTEADWLTDLHTEFTTVGAREGLSPAELRKGCCWCCSPSAPTSASDGWCTPATTASPRRGWRRARRWYASRDGLRRAIAAVVNETLRGRDERWWGTGTACASDSKKFGSWESNLMTEWHARYGGPGVMIYWHVERKSVCV